MVRIAVFLAALSLFVSFGANLVSWRARSNLRQEVYARCVAIEDAKTTLRREHTKKLRDLKENGLPEISRAQLLEEIQIELETLKGVQPIPCR